MVKQQLVNPLVFKNSLNMQMQCIACKRKNSFKSENFNRASVTDGQKRIGFSWPFFRFSAAVARSISLKNFHVISQSVKVSDDSKIPRFKSSIEMRFDVSSWTCLRVTQGNFNPMNPLDPMLFTISIGKTSEKWSSQSEGSNTARGEGGRQGKKS